MGSLSKAKTKRALAGWIFVLPLLVYFLIFQLAPLVISFVVSFTDWDGSSSEFAFVGIKNYVQILTNQILYPDFWPSIGITFAFMTFTVPLSIIVSLVVAAMLNSGIKGERIYKTAFYIPCVTASAAMSAMWLYLLDPAFGLVAGINQWLGTSFDPLHSPSSALATLAFMSVWGGLGYNVLIVESAMKNVSPSLYDACEVDGGGVWSKFIHVTLPGIMPTLYFMIITSVISSLQAFDTMYLMTNGGPEGSTTTIMLLVYRAMFTHGQAGIACAMSYFLFFIIVIITFIQFRFVPQGYQTEGDSSPKKERNAELRRRKRRLKMESRFSKERSAL